MRDDTAAAREGRLIAALSTIRDLEAKTHDPDRPAIRTSASTRPGTKPPTPIGPLSVRREALETVTSWARFVIEERELDSRLIADTAGNVAAWLLRHAGWLAQHPDHDVANCAVEEIERAADSYRWVAQPVHDRQAKVGPCPHCDGTLIATIDGERDAAGRIVCDSGGHTWEADHWQHLGRVLDPTPDLLDSIQLAAWLTQRFLTRVEPTTVRQWARRRHITPVAPANAEGDGGRPLYDRTAVADWYLEHRARRAG